MDRRDFIQTAALAGAGLFMDWEKAFALGTSDKEAGKKWKGWKKGHFQVHFIYTGVAESMFMIFPDGTTMLLDCGDHNAIGRGEKAVPVLPDASRHAGEWIARYIQRVNPNGDDVDYMMLSHYHNDHGGDERFYSKKVVRGGEDYFLSGFSEAAEYLSFRKAIDRCYPAYDDPIPLIDDSASQKTHMKKFYDYMHAERGLEIEKFSLGAIDQIKLLRRRDRYPDFSVRNITANGRIVDKEGRIIDLYEDRKKLNPKKLNENGMSLGMIFRYGDFSFYTAGDFSDKCGVSVKTLRYYDEIDLFKPIEIDLFTGYRYYSDEQLEDLNIILKLKEASFSLEEIKEYWNNFDNDIMLKKKQELLNQINIYEDKVREIDYLRSNIVKGKIILNNKKEVNNIRKKVIEKR